MSWYDINYSYINLDNFLMSLHFTDTNECGSSSTNDCDHSCVNIPGSYTCSCDPGYRLNSNERNCQGKPITLSNFNHGYWISHYSDIDECDEEIATCEQYCTNTAGSFNCGCNPGYNISLNGFSCIGEREMHH